MDAFTTFDRQQLEAAKRRFRELQANLPKAVCAYYDACSEQIVLQLNTRVEIRFSPGDADGLEDADAADLDRIEITDSGFGIQFPDLDVDLSVPAVLLGRLRSGEWVPSRGSVWQEQTEAGTSARARNKAGDKQTGNQSSNGQPASGPILVEMKTGRPLAWRGLRPIPGGLAATRAPEGAESKVEKYRDDTGGNQKHSVIRPMSPARSHAPEIWNERNDREEEEGACDLEPQDAADAAKWSQESADASGHTRAGLSAHAGHLPRVLCMNSSIDNGLSRRSGARTFRKPLSRHAARDAYADSQNPSNRLWSHPIYDGSSDSA